MGKKKIAILTINDNNNYGNRLQNYALQETLKKMNCDVTTIWQLNHSCVHKLLSQVKRNLNKKSFKLRYKAFENFNKKYLKVKEYKFPNLKSINKEFDKFVVGSDQVWNYNYNCFSDEYFLMFADSSKTISYAASFGIKDIPNNYIEKYKNGINHINNISVREHEGKNIIEKISNKNVEVVLDPTLLLSKEDWKTISKKPEFLDKYNKFGLKCFLGEMSEQCKKDIERYEKDENIKIFDLCDLIDESVYSMAPNELLYIIENANCIFTNSFHISVFSVIFNKKFFVYDKKSNLDKGMNSRIDTLLKNCNIENNRNPNYEDLNNWSIDYREVEKKIDELKKYSIAFLEKAILE